MKSIPEQYSELAGLVRSHLEQDFSPSDRLFVDSESYAFFRLQAQQQMKSKRNDPPAPQQQPQQPPKMAYTPPPAAAPAPVPQAKPVPPPQPKAEVPVPAKQEEPQKKSFFDLEPMPKPTQVDLDSVTKTFETLFPQLYVAETPKAHRKNGIAIYIICAETAPNKKAFLTQLARALFTLYGQVKMIAPEQLGQAQGVLIAPSSFSEPAGFSGTLVRLDDIDLYLQEPARKAALWKQLKPLCTK